MRRSGAAAKTSRRGRPTLTQRSTVTRPAPARQSPRPSESVIRRMPHSGERSLPDLQRVARCLPLFHLITWQTRSPHRYRAGQKPTSSALVEPKNALPVVLHADHGPVFLLRLLIEGLAEPADFRVRQTAGRTVSVLAFGVVMQHEHHQSRTFTCAGVFEHLSVTVRIAKRGARTASNHQVNALGLPSLIVVQEQLRLFGQERLAVFMVAEFRSTGR